MSNSNGYGVSREVEGAEVTSPWMTTKEAAAYCGFGSAGALLEWVRRGEVEPDWTAGSSYRFHISTLDAFLGRPDADPPDSTPESAPRSEKPNPASTGEPDGPGECDERSGDSSTENPYSGRLNDAVDRVQGDGEE